MAPVTPTCESKRLSCFRSHFSKRQITAHAGQDAGSSFEGEIAADGADGGIGEILDEPGQGVIGPALTGIGEDEDFILRRRRSRVERRRLALLAWHLDDAHAVLPGDFRGAIGGAVGDDDDLAAAGFDHALQFLKAATEILLFVVHR